MTTQSGGVVGLKNKGDRKLQFSDRRVLKISILPLNFSEWGFFSFIQILHFWTKIFWWKIFWQFS